MTVDTPKARENCRKKRSYRSEAFARVVSSQFTDGARWPYKCGLCGGWHLTSQPQADVIAILPGQTFARGVK